MSILAEKYFLKRKSTPVVFCRLSLQRLVVFWFYLLRSWANRWRRPGMESLEVSRDGGNFHRKNMIFQKELSRVFSPYYYFCPDCSKESCCLIYHQSAGPSPAPLSEVEGIFYGLPAQQITRIRKFNLTEITAGFRRQFSFLEGQPSSGSQKGELAPCVELTSTGCRLPWGERPLTCVLGLCETFARYMTWQDFWRYWALSLKYLSFLTFHLREIRSGLAENAHEV